MKKERSPIGWREWVSLPDLGVDRIKAKIDTGARTSSLHAYRLRVEREGGRTVARFMLHPVQRDARITIQAQAEVVDEREVRNSGGKAELRPVILTTCGLLGLEWSIELTLARRDAMGFRLLLGRQAIRGRFLVDPGRSFTAGRTTPTRRSKKRTDEEE